MRFDPRGVALPLRSDLQDHYATLPRGVLGWRRQEALLHLEVLRCAYEDASNNELGSVLLEGGPHRSWQSAESTLSMHFTRLPLRGRRPLPLDDNPAVEAT